MLYDKLSFSLSPPDILHLGHHVTSNHQTLSYWDCFQRSGRSLLSGGLLWCSGSRPGPFLHVGPGKDEGREEGPFGSSRRVLRDQTHGPLKGAVLCLYSLAATLCSDELFLHFSFFLRKSHTQTFCCLLSNTITRYQTNIIWLLTGGYSAKDEVIFERCMGFCCVCVLVWINYKSFVTKPLHMTRSLILSFSFIFESLFHQNLWFSSEHEQCVGIAKNSIEWDWVKLTHDQNCLMDDFSKIIRNHIKTEATVVDSLSLSLSSLLQNTHQLSLKLTCFKTAPTLIYWLNFWQNTQHIFHLADLRAFLSCEGFVCVRACASAWVQTAAAHWLQSVTHHPSIFLTRKSALGHRLSFRFTQTLLKYNFHSNNGAFCLPHIFTTSSVLPKRSLRAAHRCVSIMQIFRSAQITAMRAETPDDRGRTTSHGTLYVNNPPGYVPPPLSVSAERKSQYWQVVGGVSSLWGSGPGDVLETRDPLRRLRPPPAESWRREDGDLPPDSAWGEMEPGARTAEQRHQWRSEASPGTPLPLLPDPPHSHWAQGSGWKHARGGGLWSRRRIVMNSCVSISSST